MEILRVGMPVVLLAGLLVAGCGGGGSSGGAVSGSTFLPPTSHNGPVTGVGPTSGLPPAANGVTALPVALPSGFQEPRGIAIDPLTGNIFVTARDSKTLSSVILLIGGRTSSVLATGGALGTSGVMTNPVSLALSGDTLYVADFSSDFNAGAVGAILSIPSSGGPIKVVSAGVIDAPTGIVNANGILYVSGADPTDGLGAVFTVSTSGAVALVAKGGALTQPTGIGASPTGTVLVADAGSREAQAQLLSLSAGGVTRVSTITDSTVTNSGIASSGKKTLVAARQGGAARLSSFTNGSGAESVFVEGTPLVSPSGITSDQQGFFYVADADAGGNGLILIY